MSNGNLTLISEATDNSVEFEVDRFDLPGAVISLNLDIAGIFRRAELTDDFPLRSLNIHAPADFEDRVKKFGGRVQIGGRGDMSGTDFGLFLGKIAHSFATARLGLGSFVPFLTQAIAQGSLTGLSHYVGGQIPKIPITQTQQQHLLQLLHCKAPAHPDELLVARIRLFVPFCFPIYDVVIGRITDATPRP